MYKVRVLKDFSSAHNLRGYEGKCEALHGHNWKVEATLAGTELDKVGMLIDFKVFKKELQNIMDYLDHVYINETPPFDLINPTSEHLAKYIFDQLHLVFKDLVHSVRVWENDDASAEYSLT